MTLINPITTPAIAPGLRLDEAGDAVAADDRLRVADFDGSPPAELVAATELVVFPLPDVLGLVLGLTVFISVRDPSSSMTAESAVCHRTGMKFANT
jgi:hypothetical protein